MSEIANMLSLPEEISREICSKLDYSSLNNLVLVSKGWREVGEDPWLWRNFPLAVTGNNVNNLDNILNSRRFSSLKRLVIPFCIDCSNLEEESLYSIPFGILGFILPEKCISSKEMAALFSKLVAKTEIINLWLECKNSEQCTSLLTLAWSWNEEEDAQIGKEDIHTFFSKNIPKTGIKRLNFSHNNSNCSLFVQCEVVTVSESDIPHCLSTLSWDSPPLDQVSLSWTKLACVLSRFWTTTCKTDRGLTEDHLHFLACKVSRNQNLEMEDLDNLVISWEQFGGMPLPGRDFTFFTWFYGAVNLTAAHLSGPWSEGYITGFVSRKVTEELLEEMEAGTFLLRFSDSEVGGVVLAYLSQETNEVAMISPYTSNDLSKRSIAHRIHDLSDDYLTALFPNIDIQEAFEKFLIQNHGAEKLKGGGYVPKVLKTVLGW